MRRAVALAAAALALGVVAGSLQGATARAADATEALAGVAVVEPSGGGHDRVHSLDHHLVPALAEPVRKPLDVRGRLAGGAGLLRRVDQRPSTNVLPDAPATGPAARASGIRLRGPPTISA